MDNWKTKFGEIKQKAGEYVQKIPASARKWIVIGAAALVIFAVVAAVLLNHTEYSVLYAQVNQEEASSIGAMLQEMGVDYQYRQNGDILVPRAQEDQLRATLAYEGYPRSGFSYDIFIDNTSGMTTDSDAETYKLYDLQNRLGATISLFDGVQDAKVTIALGERQRYVLQEDAAAQASASVVVQMANGESLSAENAHAIQNLVARSVSGMSAENVSVFDENGLELSAATEEDQSSSSAEITRIIENQIEAKIINLLSPIYGNDNVRVSARASVNMERLVRESITYTTPDKIDENDKQGIISQESIAQEQSQGGQVDGGVAGAETNADITDYNIVDGTAGESYSSSSIDREYLVNQIREQGEVDPGVLDDLSVAVVINSDAGGDMQVTTDQLRELIGNAAGVPAADQTTKISVLMAPFLSENIQVSQPVQDFLNSLLSNWYFYAVVGGVILLLLLTLIVVLALRHRRKLRRLEEEEEEEVMAEPPVETANPEIAKFQNEESRNLRQNVRDFAEQNPEISAQLLREWLNGGEGNE